MVNMTLTLMRPAVLQREDEPRTLTHVYPDDPQTIEYIAHLPGGNIRVRYAGGYYLMNPAATKELR